MFQLCPNCQGKDPNCEVCEGEKVINVNNGLPPSFFVKQNEKNNDVVYNSLKLTFDLSVENHRLELASRLKQLIEFYENK